MNSAHCRTPSGFIQHYFANAQVVRPRPDLTSSIAVAIQYNKTLDSGFGFGILRRPTAYIPVGIRRNDEIADTVRSYTQHRDSDSSILNALHHRHRRVR